MNKIILTLVASVFMLLLLNSSIKADESLSSKSDPNIVSEDTVWQVMAQNFGYYKFTPYTLQMVDTMIYSLDFSPRALASYVLSKGEIADTLRCLELMVSALQNEINNPIDNGPTWLCERPFTDVIKNHYVGNILYLLGDRNLDLLDAIIKSSQGELREMLILIYGHGGAKSVRDEIRNIYLNSNNSYMRLLAVRVMNEYPDTLDIPILKKALGDIYYSADKAWVDSTSFLGTAQGALTKLRFTIEEIDEMRDTKD